MNIQTSVVSEAIGTPEYKPFGEQVSQNFAKYVVEAAGATPLTVSTKGLCSVYLEAFEEANRQTHKCNTCFEFIRQLGGLVTVGDDGALKSVLWDPETAPEYFRPVAAALKEAVESRPIEGFIKIDARGRDIDGEGTDGVGAVERGGFNHLHATFPDGFRKTTRARAADLNTYIAPMMEGLNNYGANRQIEALRQCIGIFEANSDVGRAQRHVSTMKELYAALIPVRGAVNTSRYRNMVWRFASQHGLSHRSNMNGVIGRVVEYAMDGKDANAILRVYNSMVAPDQYMRPDAPPSEQQIKAAQKLVDDLGVASAFRRRYAMLDEVIEHALWVYKPEEDKAAEKPAGKLFDNILPKPEEKIDVGVIDGGKISLTRFVKTILPQAKKLELLQEFSRINTGGITAPADPEAAPIMKYDVEGQRNPYSWFCYLRGTPTDVLGPELPPGTRRRQIEAAMFVPMHWGKTLDEISKDDLRMSFFFVTKDATIREDHRPSPCLFPELLRQDLYSIRRVIEGYNESAKLEDPIEEGQRAIGVMLAGGDARVNSIVVTTEFGTTRYIIEGWE